MGKNYRKNRFDDYPCEKMISNIIITESDHLHKQCDGGSHESSNIRTRLKCLHRARHNCDNGKKCSIINRLQYGLLKFEDEYI